MRSIYIVLLILLATVHINPQIRYSTKINSSTTINYGKMSSPDKNTIYYVYRRGDNNTADERQVKFVRSTDAGQTFSETDITLPFGSFSSYNHEPAIVGTTGSVIAYYSFDSSGTEMFCLARSTDKGSTFTYKNYRFDFPYFFSFISDGVSKYYLKYFEHFLVSTDNGATFIQKPYNIPGSLNAAAPGYLWSVSNVNDTIFIYRSTDDGSSFQFINKFLTTMAEGTSYSYSALGNQLNIVWIDDEWGAKILRMKNVTGNDVGPVQTIGNIDLLGPYTPSITQSSNRIFIEYFQKVCYSTDKGNTWSKASDQSAEAGQSSGDIIVADDTTFYSHFSEYSGGFLNLWFHNSKWTDQPFSFLKNDTLITGNGLYLVFNPSVETPGYCLQVSAFSDFSSLIYDTVSAVKAFNIFFSENFQNGTKYYYRIRGEDSNYLTQWSTSKTFIYGGTTDVKETDPFAPGEYYISQNYPNPYNPATTIKYSIPKQSKVVLSIFDALGREVQILFNEEKPAGTYEISWNAANLPSGVYFYQLKTGDFIETKKMILMK